MIHIAPARKTIPICPYCEKEIEIVEETMLIGLNAPGKYCYSCPHCKKIMSIS
jgi:uncharacterized protein with PIN domain